MNERPQPSRTLPAAMARHPGIAVQTSSDRAFQRGSPWWTGMATWPLLFPPAGVALTLLAQQRGWTWLLAKSGHEAIAPAILAPTVALLALAWRRTRNELLLALGTVSVAFLCREIHFDGSDGLLLALLVAVALWSWWHWPALRATLRAWPARSWMVASFATYLLSQIVARRAFRGLAGERAVHISLEELLETVAHLLFLWTAWCAWRDPPVARIQRRGGAG